MSKKKKIILMAIYVLISSFAVFLLRPYYLFSIIIVLFPPSLYNFFLLKKNRLNVLNFSILSLFLFAPPIELATRLKDVWNVQSILPRLFNLIPLENMLFAFINFVWVLSFYEYFIINEKNPRKNNLRYKYLIILYIVFSSLSYFLYFTNKDFLASSYFIIALIVLIIPMSLIFYYYPKLLKKTIIPTLFFAFIFFTYEFVSLLIGSWWWPGEYIYSFLLFGHVFPLDDIIIWYFLSTPALIAGYEYFAKNHQG